MKDSDMEKVAKFIDEAINIAAEVKSQLGKKTLSVKVFQSNCMSCYPYSHMDVHVDIVYIMLPLSLSLGTHTLNSNSMPSLAKMILSKARWQI